jgi:hypothetical protein
VQEMQLVLHRRGPYAAYIIIVTGDDDDAATNVREVKAYAA